MPSEASRKVRDRDYDLLVLNDTHLAPWLSDRRIFAPIGKTAHIHIDIHEYFPPSLRPGVRGRLLLNGYYKWVRSFIGHPLINSRSVASTMAEEYAREFEVPEPFIVRNCPDFADQDPSPVDPQNIRLIHHGVAAWRRGFKEMVEAMRLVEDRFTLTFMLAGNERTIAELKDFCDDQSEKITFAPAAPMRELAAVVNSYDAEVMFFPRASGEPGYALPNKLFEAIQGRLALVIGPTPPMVDLVTSSGNGVIADDWSPGALARAINSLTHEDVTRMKIASANVASMHTSQSERGKFLRGLFEAGLR